MVRCSDDQEGAVLEVRVIPRAARPGLAGERDGALVVKLTAPPVEGAANRELIAFLSTILGVSRRQLAIVSGEKGRTKRVRVGGLTAAAGRQRIEDSRGISVRKHQRSGAGVPLLGA